VGAVIVASLISQHVTLAQVLFLVGALAALVLGVVVLSHGNANYMWVAGTVFMLCIALGLLFAF
jgi:hypothetical protein